MTLLPDPLHPALVHFPIVLIFLGTIAAMVAAFWRGGHLPRYAAVLLSLAVLGGWVAMETGESDEEGAEGSLPRMESLLEAHETWAKRTQAAIFVAALAAVGSILLGRWPRAERSVAVVAAVVATYAVYETGHRGGALVYRHGVGVELATVGSGSSGGLGAVEVGTPRREIKRGHHDD